MKTLWALSLLFITLLAGVSQLTLPPFSVRPVATAVFLLLCPGAALLSVFHLDAVSDFVLSVALSLVLVTLTAEVTVLLGLWPLEANFWFLFALSVPGTALRLLRGDRAPEYVPES